MNPFISPHWPADAGKSQCVLACRAFLPLISPHWPADAGEVAEYDAFLAEINGQVEDQEDPS